MERHMGICLLSVGTEVSDWLMYRVCVCVCHRYFLGNHLMSRLCTSATKFIYNS